MANRSVFVEGVLQERRYALWMIADDGPELTILLGQREYVETLIACEQLGLNPSIELKNVTCTRPLGPRSA